MSWIEGVEEKVVQINCYFGNSFDLYGSCYIWDDWRPDDRSLCLINSPAIYPTNRAMYQNTHNISNSHNNSQL
jgi:hypothetical protein